MLQEIVSICGIFKNGGRVCTKLDGEIPGNNGSHNAEGSVSCDDLSVLSVLNDFLWHIQLRNLSQPSISVSNLHCSHRKLFMRNCQPPIPPPMSCFTDRLALLRCQQFGKILPMLHECICVVSQSSSSFFEAGSRPFFEGSFGSGHCVIDILWR
jgi:hypothetical protein